ncbi:hypothetical protein CWE12_06315 [Aliidiomarina sedimenti]|uniref:TIGR00341 family protein n=1 Tax=Aliidiomarina sedimenti TaxID=1933879 RepID=A0ABY0C093_9GAMM|nr:DUF389 domain-containing protein [Aliidiomarina sedimenti]RUO30847.1 hypothetical protein CWE12_06315 [Aliidiomarina sedimenti]
MTTEKNNTRYVEKALVVYPKDQFPLLESIHSFALTHQIELIDAELDDFLQRPGYYSDQADHVVALATDMNVREFIDLAKTLNFSLGLVPLEKGLMLSQWFKLPKQTSDAIRLAFENDPEALDILRCNDEIVLGTMNLGETPFLNQRSSLYLRRNQSAWRFSLYWLALLWSSIQTLFSIRAVPVVLSTTRKQKIRTVITGLIAFENDLQGGAARLLNTSLSAQDARFSAIVIAPKSIVQYLAFIFATLSRKRRSLQRLPAALSYIKADTLTIESAQTLKFYLDGRPRKASTIELTMFPRAARINMSDAYHDMHVARDDNKDTMRIENLPQNETRVANISRRLPFFTHALEDDFKEAFVQLRENATPSPDYVALMMLSTMVAAMGLFVNSAAVIIGAMILAPLMAPLVSAAMAILRGEGNLFAQSARTIGIGIGLSLATAAIIARLFPIEQITPEIQGRLQPAILDLGIAIACGVAGAYAYARSSVMRSLPGVAIAVALVPPLCVVGIGLGWWRWDMVYGAGLLFVTNLVGVIGAAVITFLVLGFAPVQRAKRGLAITAVSIVLITIPLSLSFAGMYQHWQFERDTAQRVFLLSDVEVRLVNVDVSLSQDTIVLRAETLAAAPLSPEQALQLKAQLESRWERDVVLELGHRIRL